MAGRRLAMSKQKEILRLKKKGLSARAIARVLKCSRNTVKHYLSLNNESINNMSPEPPGWVQNLDWNEIHAEVHMGTPLNVLWEERFEDGKIPVQYAGFWKQYFRKFPSMKDATMIKHFAPGERAEIDYCDGIDILDVATGEIVSTQLFVGVLCKSRYTFAEFSFSQKSLDFLSSHVRMFEFFGGVPATLAPDNLKSAVTKAHPYDPEKNQAYSRLASHYDVAITPARVRTPKDKALVERTVQIFQRWFYFKVRKRTFTSLMELNASLREHLDIFHNKKHRIFQRTRNEMFKDEKDFLQPLPNYKYEVSLHKKATLQADCHLVFEKTFYSAPHQYRGNRLDVWASDKTVEIISNGETIAIHSRSYSPGGFRTDNKHYPPQHQAYLEATPEQLRERALKVGEDTYTVINRLMSTRYPLRFLRRAQGILALIKKYSCKQLELACNQALAFEKYHVPFIENLIKNQTVEIDSTKIKRASNPHLRGDGLFH